MTNHRVWEEMQDKVTKEREPNCEQREFTESLKLGNRVYAQMKLYYQNFLTGMFVDVVVIFAS